MGLSAVEVIQQVYQAFGRGDVPGVLTHIADRVDWRVVGARGLAYTGACHTRAEVAGWFASVVAADEIQLFEPREFIACGDHVTVLGWERTASRPWGAVFDTEWVHVFTVHDGRIVRFWGIYDTEASATTRA